MSKQKHSRKDASGPSAGRRKLLKSAALSGAAAGACYLAPERWSRPVIEAVTLPAHAQMSPLSLSAGPWAGGSGNNITMRTDPQGRSLAGRIADFVMPAARAGVQVEECRAVFLICIENVNDGNTIEVRIGFPLIGEVASDTIALPDDLAFNEQIGDYAVAGAYDADGDRWTGTAEGPCPNQRIAAAPPRGDNGVFTGESIQVASASPELRLAGGVVNADLDVDWEATRNAPCELDALED